MLRVAGGVCWLVVFAFLAAEKRILRSLRRAHATTPETAIPLTVTSLFARIRFKRLCRAGAILASAPDRHYLDPEGFRRYNGRRRRRALTVIAVLLTAVLLWWMVPISH